MNSLNLEPNFSDADAFYAALADIHRDRSPQQSEQINARLILLLANQVGDQAILQQALEIASQLDSETQDDQ
ncbi:MAG: DUF2783 domain-containing protein [Halieaceae bacterium]|nr:DUF2783 domain-containing protein [Halieaceae bacterium]MCP5194800.1 DUF2783 domain-containing protein [Pseudomonadales bacterium]